MERKYAIEFMPPSCRIRTAPFDTGAVGFCSGSPCSSSSPSSVVVAGTFSFLLFLQGSSRPQPVGESSGAGTTCSGAMSMGMNWASP